MIEEQARVVDAQDGFAWVETERKSTCGGCVANRGCGAAALSRVLGQRRARVRVLNAIGALVGDEVVIGIREDALVRGSLAMYAVPLVGLLGGAVLGEYVTRRWDVVVSESLVIAAGLLGLAFGLFWLRRFARRVNADARYQPVILRKASQMSVAVGAGPIR